MTHAFIILYFLVIIYSQLLHSLLDIPFFHITYISTHSQCDDTLNNQAEHGRRKKEEKIRG